MKNHRKWLLVLVVVAMSGLVARWARRPVATVETAPAANPSSVEAAPAGGTEAGRHESSSSASRFGMFHWVPGASGCYEFEVSIRLAQSAEALDQGYEKRLGGRLEYVVLDAGADRVNVAAILREAYFVDGTQRLTPLETLLGTTPALLTLSPTGRLLGLRFPPETPADDRQVLGLAYGWQFVLQDAPVYQEDDNPPGVPARNFRATYQRSGEANIRKQRSLLPAPDEEPGTYQRVLKSEFAATVGANWLAAMDGAEDSVMYFNGKLVTASRVSIHLAAVAGGSTSPMLAAMAANGGAGFLFSGTPSSSPAHESASQAVARENLAARWKGVAFDDVRSPLEAAAAGPLQGALKPLHDLEDWLTANPDDGPVAVLDSLATMTADHDSSALLVHALAQAATPATLKALDTILNDVDHFPPTVVIQAAAAAGSVTAGDSGFRETLRGLLDSQVADEAYHLSDTALFAFARLSKDDADSQSFLIQRLSPWMESGQSNDMVKALNAFGNAVVRDDSIVGRAQVLVQSDDPDIRLAAQQYLAVISAQPNL